MTHLEEMLNARFPGHEITIEGSPWYGPTYRVTRQLELSGRTVRSIRQCPRVNWRSGERRYFMFIEPVVRNSREDWPDTWERWLPILTAALTRSDCPLSSDAAPPGRLRGRDG